MAQAAWLPPLPAISDRSMNVDAHPSQPRPLPPPAELARWEFTDLLHSRPRKMTAADYAQNANGQAGQGRIYGQAEIDQAFSSLQNGGADASPSALRQHQQQQSNGMQSQQSFAPHGAGLDAGPHVPDHANYDLFSGSASNSAFVSSRYRTNASSSSSLGQHFGLGGAGAPDGVYGHPSFDNSLSSFHPPGAGYDHSLSSSYSSGGKVSPLTPNDPVPGMHPAGFPSSLGMSQPRKDYPSHSPFSDMSMDQHHHRRLSSNGYPSDFHDDLSPLSAGPAGFGALGAFGQNGAHYQDRMGQFGPEAHRASLISQMPGHHDLMSGVPPQATHFRSGPGLGYDHLLAPHPGADMSLMRTVDETLSVMNLQGMGSANDLETFMRPFLDQYVRTPNRLAFGERTIIVMSSKVAQKSYGTEKRFLCPPPTAIMIGNSWWSESLRRGEEPKHSPPRCVVSISGEPAPSEGSIEWTSTSGKSFDVNDPPTGTTFIGRCVGKQLFISDVDEKKKKVEALVKVMAPLSDDEPERVIGTFPSRPIKVISKPSKKRQSAKNLELCINHGSTISLFHRLRSQTVSTKYLCVSGSGSSFKGSDGAPLMGLDQRNRAPTPSFIARTSSWDPFVMYIVDVNKPSAGIDAPPPPPPQPEYPSPPPNAIPFTNNGSQIPIYYNQTVVLQCLTSGVVSPVLIIRKVDHGTTVVGGGLQEGAKNVAESYCVPGEVCGDPVSQLHKVAFEVYDATKGVPEHGTPGVSGPFLSCMGEKVNTYRPVDGRHWSITQAQLARSDSPTMSNGMPHTASPLNTPSLANSPVEYFGGPSAGAGANGDSAPGSPTMDMSNDGGRVKKKRGSSSAGGVSKTSSAKSRSRRPTSAGSSASGGRGGGDSLASSGALWQVDIGESSVWTIVGTDQVRYNFYIPPVLFDNQTPTQTGSFPIPSKPVTPFPGVVKYLPPDRAAEVPKCPNSRPGAGAMMKPNPHASKMLTVYGENFSKTEPLSVFFGSEPSPYVEIRCTEVLGCLPPESQITKRRPIILVRHDGVVFPSSTVYP